MKRCGKKFRGCTAATHQTRKRHMFSKQLWFARQRSLEALQAHRIFCLYSVNTFNVPLVSRVKGSAVHEIIQHLWKTSNHATSLHYFCLRLEAPELMKNIKTRQNAYLSLLPTTRNLKTALNLTPVFSTWRRGDNGISATSCTRIPLGSYCPRVIAGERHTYNFLAERVCLALVPSRFRSNVRERQCFLSRFLHYDGAQLWRCVD